MPHVLLKQKQIGSIACWEEELSRSSAYISVQRKKAVEFVGAKAAGFFAAFSSEKLPLVLNYVSGVRPIDDVEELRKLFMQEFERKRNQEVHLGVTLVGPTATMCRF